MRRDLLAPTELSTRNSDSEPTPPPTLSHELERASSSSPEVLNGEDNAEVLNVMQLLLERGVTVEPGTQVIESPFGDDMLYDVTHFYGVETRLPEGVARYTVRGWRRTFSDEYRADLVGKREGLGLPPDSHEAFLEGEGAAGILVVSSWTDEVDGQPRKVENTLSYIHPNNGVPTAIHTENGIDNRDIPESLISPLVTPTKLSGELITLEDARSEGDVTRKEFEGDHDETFVKRALGKLGLRRRKG